MRDSAQYRQLYLHHYKKLYNYGRKFTADTSLIEDSIQDVFMDFWNRGAQTVEETAVQGYLFTAFRFSLFKKIGKAKRLVLLPPGFEPDFSAEQILIQEGLPEETSRQIQTALQQLTSRQREALFLRFYEGMAYEEVAAVMHITTKAMYKLMARSLVQLKGSLSLPLLLLLYQTLKTAGKNM